MIFYYFEEYGPEVEMYDTYYDHYADTVVASARKKGGHSSGTPGRGGGKGKKSSSSKKGGKEADDYYYDDYYTDDAATPSPSPVCETFTLKYFLQDIEDGREEIAGGDSLTYPLYDPVTSQIVGNYSDVATYFGPDGSHCVFNAVYSFNSAEAAETLLVRDQVMTQGTCAGAFNSIIGGTGDYACATGYDTFAAVAESDPMGDFGIVVLRVCMSPVCDEIL